MQKIKIFKIYDDHHPLLRKTLKPVSLPVSKEIKETLFQMVEYLKASQDEKFHESHPSIRPGVGLSANQIGIDKRFFAIYFKDGEEEIKFALVNPRIIKNSLRKCALSSGEGCLSVKQDHKGLVYRYSKITLRGYDCFLDQEIDIEAEGYLSIVLQHELDHLNGKIYYDYIDKMDPNHQIPNSYLL